MMIIYQSCNMILLILLTIDTISVLFRSLFILLSGYYNTYKDSISNWFIIPCELSIMLYLKSVIDIIIG